MRKILFSVMALSCVIALGLTGCSKKADTGKPIEQIQKEVQNMQLSDLQQNAQAYAREIQGKQTEVTKVIEKIKTLTPTEVLGAKASEIKSEASAIQSKISELTKRYEIYAQKYQEKGGDLSQIKIS